MGFDETDILPFGGRLIEIDARPGALVPATYVPPFPVYPPETSWMRTTDSGLPCVVISETPRGSRLVYLAADIDRRYAKDNLPDHGRLLDNLIRWGLHGEDLLAVDGPGLIDCHLYRQPRRLILHLVNLTGPGAWRSPAEEVVPVGPLSIEVRQGFASKEPVARLLVSDTVTRTDRTESGIRFTVPSVGLHEVVVIE